MKRQIEISDRQRGILRQLVFDEAKRLGYGVRYHDGNTSVWPPRLRQMLPVIRQLNPHAPPWSEPTEEGNDDIRR